MINDINTLHFRLAVVSPTSTGHQYLLKDHRTGMTLYFDDVRVYKGVMDEIKFYDGESDRAGYFRGLDQMEDCIIDALKHIEEEGEFPKPDNIVSAGHMDVVDA